MGEQERPWEDAPEPQMVFADPASQALVRLLERIAPSDLPVMISGEAGTGKEAMARYIHRISGRTGAFVAVNCSALADQLQHRESSAAAVPASPAGFRIGEQWFEAARHGTLFLDDLAELPADVQGQLLCLLQRHETRRAGPQDLDSTDVRLISATRVDVSEVVSAGHFHLDLFCRLNIGQIRLLPLRQRRGDIAALTNHYLRVYGKRLSTPSALISQEVLAALSQYPWPGNVSELANVIRCALLVASGPELKIEHLKLGAVAAPAITRSSSMAARQEDEHAPQTLSTLLVRMFEAPGARLFDDVESQVVRQAFRFTGGNQVRTAALLGISRNVLRTLLKKHGVFSVRRRKR